MRGQPRIMCGAPACRSSSRPTASQPAKASWWRRRSPRRSRRSMRFSAARPCDAGAGGRDRGIPCRRRSLLSCPRRWRQCRAARHRRGPQARLRRRPRSQYRRNGRLFAGFRDDAGRSKTGARRDRNADAARDEGDGRTLQGRALCRADDHQRGTEADRIQCAVRRPGMPGADAAPDVRPRAGA